MRSRAEIRCAAGLWCATLLLGAVATRGASDRPVCGTPHGARFEARAARAEPPGKLLRVLQDPEFVTPGHRGKIRYELAVLGDFDSVGFEIATFSGVQTFSVARTGSYVNPTGDVISFFEVEGTLEEWLVLPWSWDFDLTSPLIFSELLYVGPAGNEQPIFMPLTLLPRSTPRSPVRRSGPRVQYASNIINVAVPGLHQAQIDSPGFLGIIPNEVVETIWAELGDLGVDEFGLGLWQYEMTNSGAYHVDAQPGSPYPAHSVYTGSAFLARELWKHEISHNWNFGYDLPRLVGWDAPFDGYHSRGTVARDAGMLCCGGYPKSRSQGRWRTDWVRDSHSLHPLELFAMGLIDASEVPDMWVFRRQDLRDFAPGEVLSGPTRRLSIDQIIAEYGEPEPSPSNTWRVAPVVVSERLLPKKTLSALNFLMRRIEDPEGIVPDSFDKATRYLMDLQTTIQSPEARVPRPPQGVAFPAIGKREIPGVTLGRELPGCVRPGEAIRLQGRTISRTPPAIALVPSNPDYPTLDAPEQANHRFDVMLTPEMEDVYQVLIEEAWPREAPLPIQVGPIYVTKDCPSS